MHIKNASETCLLIVPWFYSIVFCQSSVLVAFPKCVSFQMQLHMYENTLLNKDASLQKVGTVSVHGILETPSK